MRARVMLVDDHLFLGDKVKASLFSHSDRWDVEVVGSEREALNLLSLLPCDVLIAGMNGIDAQGVGMMARLRQESPNSIRIAVALPEDDKCPSGLGLAHRIIPNSCSGDRLNAAISGALSLKARLANPGLANFIANADVLPLPQADDLALLEELADPDPDHGRLAALLQMRPDYARRILRLAVLFEGAYAADLPGAVQLLGPDAIRAVVMFESVHRQLPLDRLRRTGLANLKSHGYELAHVARQIATGVPGGCFATAAFVGGLLHDLGALVLATNKVSDYRRMLKQALREDRALIDAERKHLGVAHGDVGIFLSGLWGIPEGQSELLEDHAKPAGPCPSPAGAIRLANLILGDPGEPRGAIETRYGRSAGEFAAWQVEAKQVRDLAGLRLCD